MSLISLLNTLALLEFLPSFSTLGLISKSTGLTPLEENPREPLLFSILSGCAATRLRASGLAGVSRVQPDRSALVGAGFGDW